VAASVAEVAERADVVGVGVATEAQVEDVLLGSGGLLPASHPGAAIFVHSTIHPRLCIRLANEAAKHRVGLVDVGFSGGYKGARAGRLTLMAGGEVEHLERCKPALWCYAQRIVRLGGPGAGMAAKIINNLLVYDGMQTLAEALRLAKAAGVDGEQMLDIITSSSGDSWVARHWDLLWYQRGYETGPEGHRIIVDKDLSLALDLAHEYDASLPVTELVATLTEEFYETETVPFTRPMPEIEATESSRPTG
jgi:3-hydroxyisobutyrate dehydrogenase